MKTKHISPARYRGAAAGTAISYGFCSTPFGESMLAWNDEGICFLGFVAGGRTRPELIRDLLKRWPGATLTEDASGARKLAAVVFDPKCTGHKDLTLLLKGTPFQIAVWEALLRIPFGATISYTRIAREAGYPEAVRAAASAVGRNDISYLVPCHRVIRSDGSPGGYYWGLPCKRAILFWEAANKSE